MTKRAWTAALGYGLLFVLLLIMHWRLRGYCFDDAYIHFRIAENLARNGAPFFNSGESVMASSSSLWTIILAFVSVTVKNLVSATAWLNAAALTATIYVTAKILEAVDGNTRYGAWHAAAIGLFLPMLSYSSLGLMESAMAIFVMAAGILAYLEKKTWSFTLLALSPFLRIELGVIPLIIFLYNLKMRQVPVRKSVWYVLFGAAPMLAYDMIYFHTLLPHTVHAKKVVYAAGMRRTLLEMLPMNPVWPQFRHIYNLAIFSGLGLTTVWTVWKEGDRRSHWAAMMFAAGLTVLSAYVLTKALMFHWYRPNFLYGIVLAGTILSARRRNAWLILVLAFLLLPYYRSFVLDSAAVLHGEPQRAQRFEGGARVRKYLDVARRLHAAYPGQTLMSSEIGALGYGYPGKLFDGVGLIDRRALKFHPMKVPEERRNGRIGAIPPGYVREVNPGLIVGYDIFIEAVLKSDAADAYQDMPEPVYCADDLARTQKHDLWGSRQLHILIRKDLLHNAMDTAGPAEHFR